MSLYSFNAGRVTPVYKLVTVNTEIELLAAGANGATIVALSINNIGGGTPTVGLTIKNASAVTVARRSVARPMAAKENWAAVSLNGVPIDLLPNHTLYITASAGNEIDVDGSYIAPPESS